MRDLIGKAPADEPPRIRIRLDAEWDPNQKSYLVWGSLPGATDETIYIIGHRDGWFDAAGDNASGIATMLGLAEHFAKGPQSQRRRTIVFIGTDGHHQNNPGGYGREWLAANRERFFSKTALMINAEHPSQVLTHGGTAGWTDTIIPNAWYGGGPSRPDLTKMTVDAFREFGVPLGTSRARTRRGRHRPVRPVRAGRRGSVQRLLVLPHVGRHRRDTSPGPGSRRRPAPTRG